MIKNFLHSFSYIGLLVALLFFSASLTPSMLPRPPILQGILSGFLLGIGYGVGKTLVFVWRYLEFIEIDKRYWVRFLLPLTVLFGILALFTLNRMTV